ncbi:MAG: hypothetical protein QME49_08275 [bacterium]|nr:hypothetical protein [bacterium]
MESRKLTNIFLLIIVTCLLLIVVRIYNVNLVSEVQAQWAGKTLSSYDLLPVAIHAKNANGHWYPCEISGGDKLMVEVTNFPFSAPFE